MKIPNKKYVYAALAVLAVLTVLILAIPSGNDGKRRASVTGMNAVLTNEMSDRENLAKMERALKDDGAIYVSFKCGTFEGERNGRYFTDMTLERLQECLEAAAGKYGGK